MKDFHNWHILKQKIHGTDATVFIQPREIWYVHLGENIGFEENGKGTTFERPVLVLKRWGRLFLVIPMTTKGQESEFYYTLPTMYFQKTSRLILSQLKIVDRNRFIRKNKTVQIKDFENIKKKLKTFLF